VSTASVGLYCGQSVISYAIPELECMAFVGLWILSTSLDLVLLSSSSLSVSQSESGKTVLAFRLLGSRWIAVGGIKASVKHYVQNYLINLGFIGIQRRVTRNGAIRSPDSLVVPCASPPSRLPLLFGTTQQSGLRSGSDHGQYIIICRH